jgi:hypothetical protein
MSQLGRAGARRACAAARADATLRLRRDGGYLGTHYTEDVQALRELLREELGRWLWSRR